MVKSPKSDRHWWFAESFRSFQPLLLQIDRMLWSLLLRTDRLFWSLVLRTNRFFFCSVDELVWSDIPFGVILLLCGPTGCCDPLYCGLTGFSYPLYCGLTGYSDPLVFLLMDKQDVLNLWSFYWWTNRMFWCFSPFTDGQTGCSEVLVLLLMDKQDVLIEIFRIRNEC